MEGVCGTCAQPAQATAENEGYSYCCNDRIEYGAEAEQTVARANCKHAAHGTRVEDAGTAWAVTCCEGCGEVIGYGEESA
jgi:hypothetical protein